jgi:outer membrane protein assembly factor BamB
VKTRALSRAAAALACVAVLSTAAAASNAGLANSPWPVFGHDAQHTGRSEHDGPQNPRVLWKYRGDHRIFSTPSIGADGTIYLGHGRNPLCAIDPSDGSEIWCTTKNDGTSADRSSPAVAATGMIYIGGRDNDLWTVNPDGSVQWTFHVPTDGDVTTSPMVGVDGTIFMGSDSLSAGYFYAMVPGPVAEVRWLNILGGGVRNVSPALSHDGSTVYVTSAGHTLHALDAATGVELWRRRLERRANAQRGPNYTPVVGDDGTIYVGLDEGLFAIAPDGTERWLHALGRERIQSPPAIGPDGTLYVVAARAADGLVLAVSPEGEVLWSHELLGRMVNTAPVVDASGVVYVAAWDELYAFEPNGDGAGHGTVRWRRAFSRRVFDAGPIISGPGRILIGSRDRFLYALGD